MERSISETAPHEMQTSLAGIPNLSNQFGLMTLMLTGLILPKQSSEFFENWSWRIVYALPILFAFIQLIIFSAKFKWEPINYLIDK